MSLPNAGAESLGQRALRQQGYDYTPEELRELDWGLRFTPAVCMLGAVVGLVLRAPAIHFALAALGILPFWLPAAHPVDLLYNHLLRPLWGGVRLPPNPLPRRIACLMGGAMNLAIGVSFVAGSVAAAYAFGAVLIVLQLVVISTHFCVASWMYEGLLKLAGRWDAPVDVGSARAVLAAGGMLVDVRSPEEFARGHLEGAVNLPVEAIAERAAELGDRELVLYCRSGMRSQRAAQVLRRRGCRRVHNLGAMSRWRETSPA
jgi:rhodanese-related sulfurtransferase